MQHLKNIDQLLFHFINQTIQNPFFDWWLPIFRNAESWIPLYVFLAIYLIFKYREKSWIYIVYLLISFALADSISHEILKPWFARLRPCHQFSMHARLVLGYCGGKWSFPSTHASNHMAIALSIVFAQLFVSRRTNLFWLLWAFLIGFAQIYVGVHYPSDILAGFVFGGLIAVLNYVIILPLIREFHSNLIMKGKDNKTEK